MLSLPPGKGALRYVVEGRPLSAASSAPSSSVSAAPPVVLVHDGLTDHHVWDEVAPVLAADRTVVRYDLRGFGQSPPPDGPFEEVADLAALLDHLGLARVNLAGLSWGGRIAVEFALTHPERVSALAAFSPPWPGFDRSPELRAYDAAEGTALAAGDLDAAVEVNLDMWLRGPARPWSAVPPALISRVRAPLRTALANQPTVEAHSQPGTALPATALTSPTLIGAGALDTPDFVSMAHHYATAIPTATLVPFPTAGHLIPLEAPAAVVAALRGVGF
ncbi:alpha/beta fold hydrolase [Streptomyces sp. NRRL F-5123]|uniref:alpha/beta fold hydrolase n=1 Tax=Streptomyces sp. NRRL F-5123 TaxID=1463856 RepID=UPI0004E17924|nr:alpha/beta fold hydrolase [Streptomyces sp. NRRL F-5123]